MAKFSILFKGGSHDLKVGQIEMPKFSIGMIISFNGGEEVYKVADGPVAQLFEKKQEGSPYLVAVATLVEDGADV